MDGNEELRTMWEFAATWKLLQLLSIPLSFVAPTANELEKALLNPAEHISLIANLHGRLLGLSTGTTSAKKWMQFAVRFIRNRVQEFPFLLEDPLKPTVNKVEAAFSRAEEEHVEQDGLEPKREMEEEDGAALTVEKPFPTDEAVYYRFQASTRLLTLHTIAEIVNSEHDSLLCAGSIADIELQDMRLYPFANDAVGNNYWYFGDLERVYREPGRVVSKTRLQKAEDDAKAAELAQKEAAANEAKLAREAKKKETQKKQEEIKRRREERKKKQMERWGPRVAASRSTRASRRAEAQAILESRDADHGEEEGTNGKTRNVANDHHSRHAASPEDIDLEGGDEVHSDRAAAGRRVSGRRRKASREEEQPTPPTRTPKRPRKTNLFADPELRACDGWEVIAHGSESLRNLIDRLRPEGEATLSSEKALVNRLEETILPDIVEKEERERKEEERLEKKRRNEIILASLAKRSSRVQARAQRREEEARRIAEEEERERKRQERVAHHAELVRAQVASLESEQSREIRNIRRTHGRVDAIERDDQLQKVLERKKARRDKLLPEAGLRRSTRAHRTSRRLIENDSCDFPDMPGSNAQSDDRDLAMEIVENERNVEEKSEEPKTDTRVDQRVESGTREVETPSYSGPALPIEIEAEGASDGADTIVESKPFEESVTELFTWSRNPDDDEPIRVLDKFFFASAKDFSDAPLEMCDDPNACVLGFGILVPPPESSVRARRVEIKEVAEWVIEYGADARMWVKTPHAWYELRDPAVEYRDAFASTRRKFEICIRVSILGDTMRSAQLTYETMVDLLSYRYEEMMSYSESDILAEKRFIVSQMEALNKRAMMTSGFIKELTKRIKLEDSKAATVSRREAAKAQKEEPAEDRGKLKDSNASKASAAGKGQEDSVPKKPVKRRSSSSAQTKVPRAVSSLIASVLKAAMKGRNPPRKRKRRHDAEGNVAKDDSRPAKASKKEPILNGFASVGAKQQQNKEELKKEEKIFNGTVLTQGHERVSETANRLSQSQGTALSGNGPEDVGSVSVVLPKTENVAETEKETKTATTDHFVNGVPESAHQSNSVVELGLPKLGIKGTEGSTADRHFEVQSAIVTPKDGALSAPGTDSKPAPPANGVFCSVHEHSTPNLDPL